MPIVLALALWCGASVSAADAIEQDKTVRVIYLVSRDRETRMDYKQAIEHAIIDVRKWYEARLDKHTFRLHDPVVEVAKSSENADWFYKHENGRNKDDWGYNNAFAEVKRLLGARFNDPHYVWVIYSDGPGDKGRGGSSVTVLPEDDLLGLIGQHPVMKKKERWIGGLAHELGHAFGLPHPADTKADYEAIMWAGFYDKYPNGAYFTKSDKETLLASPFFFNDKGQPATATAHYVEKYVHARGHFGKTRNKGAEAWVEGSTDSTNVYHFEELVRDASFIFLKDRSRGYSIKIPVKGGMSEITGDDGLHWQDLYFLRKE